MISTTTKPKIQIDGLILLDKPRGLSSNAALQQVKRVLRAKKAGHTGSLDPLASGLLPICLGQATKFSQFLLNADKTYHVMVKLGVRTTTGDVEGEVVSEKRIPKINEKQLEELFDEFRGNIDQVPSMYSALKHKGKPLYQYARQGIEIERPARPISIFTLRLLKFKQDEIEIFVHCSKGTYIRSLVDDIGQLLGCGAHVTFLRRLSVGPFQAEQMLLLDEIASGKISEQVLPLKYMLLHMPTCVVSPAIAFFLKRGQAVLIPKAPAFGLVSIEHSNGQLIGVGEVLPDGKVTPRRLLV